MSSRARWLAPVRGHAVLSDSDTTDSNPSVHSTHKYIVGLLLPSNTVVGLFFCEITWAASGSRQTWASHSGRTANSRHGHAHGMLVRQRPDTAFKTPMSAAHADHLPTIDSQGALPVRARPACHCTIHQGHSRLTACGCCERASSALAVRRRLRSSPTRSVGR